MEPMLLLAGGSGQVGVQLLARLETSPEWGRVLQANRRGGEGQVQLDLGTLQSKAELETLFAGKELTAIVCSGAMTHVDGCEDSEELAFNTNARGPALLAAFARDRGAPFLWYSTEYVFDGSEEHPGPYREDDTPRPLNAYGRSKLAGERAVLEAHPGALVLRTTVVYGADPRRKNFLYTLVERLSRRETMRVAGDQVSTPTYNEDLAAASLGLMQAGAHGVYHVCGPEVMDRFVFAKTAAEVLGLPTELIESVSTASLGQTAKRPLQAGLSTEKLRREFPGLTMRTLREGIHAVAQYLKQG